MTYVDSPPTSAYAPPALDFSWLANLPKDYYQGQQQRQQSEQSQAFKNGLPMNPDGSVNYSAVMQTLAKLGDVNAITTLGPTALKQQQQAPQALDPMLAGTVTPGGMPASNPPASAAAVVPTAQQGDSGATASTPGDQIGVAPSVEALAAKSGVSDTVAANIARALKVQPNAPLNAQQWQAAQKYLQAYLARTGQNGQGEPRGLRNDNPGNIENGSFAQSEPGYTGVEPQGRYATFSSPQAGLNASADLIAKYAKQGINTISGIVSKWAPSSDGNNVQNYAGYVAKQLGVDPNQPLNLQDPQVRGAVATAMAQFENGTKNIPPSAGAVSQAPSQGGGQQPLVPQVPLPRGFTDPQQAILALNAEAGKILNQPAKQGQAAVLQNWADAIEKSIQPVKVGPTESLLDPRTGKPLYQGAFMGGAGMLSGPALDQAAEAYYQTGKTPTNMGRGMQGAAGMNAVITRATELHPDDPVSAWPARWQQFKTQGGYTDEVANIADAIKSGDQPPILTGLYRLGGPVRSQLEKDGVDLSQLNLEWQRAVKQVASLNGPQMTRFVGLAQSVENTIDEVRRLSDQMENSGIPLANRAKLTAYIQAEGNSANGQLAARYIGATNTLKEEFANLAQGGYAPTEAVWALANRQIDENYGVKELNSSLDEVQRLIKYRLNAMPGIASLGPGAPNQYTGQQGQVAPQSPSTGAPPSKTYTNPKTGQKLMLSPDGQSWVPAQ